MSEAAGKKTAGLRIQINPPVFFISSVLTLAFVAAALLLAGGLGALRTATIASAPSFVLRDTCPSRAEALKYYRAEVHLREVRPEARAA